MSFSVSVIIWQVEKAILKNKLIRSDFTMTWPVIQTNQLFDREILAGPPIFFTGRPKKTFDLSGATLILKTSRKTIKMKSVDLQRNAYHQHQQQQQQEKIFYIRQFFLKWNLSK